MHDWESCQTWSDIKRRSDETYAKLPAYLRFQSEEITSAQAPYDFFIQIVLSLELLLNRFLLERLPDDGSQQNKQDLINTSKEMLDRVILPSAHRDRLVDHQVPFAWAVVYMGIPSARLLSVELLKQSKYPQLYPLTLACSKIIQNLSILLGCLGSIRLSQGNHALCVRMRKVIRRVLDQVLEPALNINAMPTLTSMDARGCVTDVDVFLLWVRWMIRTL